MSLVRFEYVRHYTITTIYRKSKTFLYTSANILTISLIEYKCHTVQYPNSSYSDVIQQTGITTTVNINIHSFWYILLANLTFTSINYTVNAI